MEKTSDNMIITYEYLFELTRKERLNGELERLEPTFYQDVIAYFKEQPAELANAKKIVTEIYDKRIGKVISLAVEKSRLELNDETKGRILWVSANTAWMLKEERALFEQLLSEFDRSRDKILKSLLSLKMPEDAD